MEVTRDENREADGNGLADDDEARSRRTQPVDGDSPPRLPFTVVGVGASAGGLEAYIEFLQACPPTPGMAFVLVQHLSPQHESMMAELLAKHTAMPVLQVADLMPVEPNHVYVIRPGFTMTIRDGHLHLGDNAAERMHRRPVDDFFRSLAEEQRGQAVCVLLSGTGSNGTGGAQAVKAVGGLCIAQDPSTAKFPAMPRSLIDTGLADAILRPGEMFEAIRRFADRAIADGNGASPEAVARRERAAINEVIAVLRTRQRHDFSGYKKPTMVRRIQRRMNLLQVESMSDYARTLRQNPGEVTALNDDLMIHVTGFFRDPEVWAALRVRVIDPLVAEKPDGGSVRCWVTACSSGEEAYTLGILLVEACEAAGKTLDIKIFATDTAERSLRDARGGIFPGGIESDVTPQRLDRFFDRDDVMYRVKKELRERVVFAPQNVLQDPPFSRLDLVTCRNLLIYIEPDIQRRVLSVLHFGLRERGVLLLGTSESIGGVEHLFEAIDKKLRIYRRLGPSRGLAEIAPPPLPIANASAAANGEARPAMSPSTIQQAASRALLDGHTPAAIVVDRAGDIVYFHGATERYLVQPRGAPTREAVLLARDEIRGALRTALQRVQTQCGPVHVRDGTIGEGADRMRIEIHAAPLDGRATCNVFLVTFTERPDPPPAPADPHVRNGDGTDRHAELADELRRVRDELQSTVEELQTSNEEMKASHEEATSVNEELQSTNEELETSKEELQSLNEELSTVNAQLQAKMEELERTTNDLASLLGSTDIAVIFLDPRFRIRRFTAAMRVLMELIPGDTGRPLSDMARKFEDPDLIDDARAVLERLVPIEREVVGHNGRWYVRRALPYRTLDNRIEGVVITFVDVHDRRAAELARHAGEERVRQLLAIMPAAVYGVALDGTIAYYNARAVELWGRAPAADDVAWALAGGPRVLLPDGTPVAGESSPLTRVLREGASVVDRELVLVRPDGTRIDVQMNIAPLLGPDGAVAGAVNVFQDVTERKRVETMLRHAKDAAEIANRVKDDFLATLSHELRTPLTAILVWTRLLATDPAIDAAKIAEGLDMIEQSADEQRKLVEDLLDSARITSGTLRLDMVPTQLKRVVAEAVDAVRPTAESKGLALRTDLGDDVGIVMADPSRIRQVVWNLLSNAVKFTPAGGRIDVGLWRRGDQLEIRVADTGRGIDAAFLPQVFERFRQDKSVTGRSSGGLGLGLAIVSELVQMHNGTITAQSDGAGRGATFTVLLPMPRVSDAT